MGGADIAGDGDLDRRPTPPTSRALVPTLLSYLNFIYYFIS